MEALLHLLRYLRDNMYLGLKFYSDITMSPITIDTGRSSGCFMIFYMGGMVEHSSIMPDPVALSSAEAEYNEACLACMATAHLNISWKIWNCLLQMIRIVRSQFRSSLIIGVQLTWVQVSRIHREHEI